MQKDIFETKKGDAMINEKNLKQMNLSVTDIIKATGLTEKEIEAL